MSPLLTKHKILLVLAALLAFFISSLPQYVREIGSAKWPSASGIITRSNLRTAYVHRRNFTGYVPEVEYQYSVDDRLFTGTQITFHLGSTVYEKDYAESWLEKYPTGQVVSVYYDPNAPSTSVLQPGIQSEQRWLFYEGIGFIVLLTVAFLVVLYDYRRCVALVAAFRQKYVQKV